MKKLFCFFLLLTSGVIVPPLCGALLEPGDFSGGRKLPEKELATMRRMKFVIASGEIPRKSRLLFSRIDTAGSLKRSSDGQTWEWSMPSDRWMSNLISTERMTPVGEIGNNSYRGEITASGKGSIRFIVDFYRDGQHMKRAELGDVVLSDRFIVRRSNEFTIKVPPNATSVRAGIALYGTACFRDPALKEIPAIDPAAEQTFALPFERSMQAVFSRGSVTPFDSAQAPGYVAGVRGMAARFSRTINFPRENSVLRLPVGPRFESQGIFAPGRGTFECFFRPLPELLSYPTFNCYYLFYSKGPVHAELFLRRNKSAVELCYRETPQLAMRESGEHRSAPPQMMTVKIGDVNAAITEKWRHVAFCYDAKKRTIFLDGKPCAADMMKQDFQPGDFFTVAGLNNQGPFVPSCDIDEWNVYRGIRYRDKFSPQEALAAATLYRQAAPVPPGEAPEKLTSAGKWRLSADRRRIVIPLKAGNDKFELSVAFHDGMALVMNSRGLKIARYTSYDEPYSPPLLLADRDGKFTAVELKIDIALHLRPENGVLRLDVKYGSRDDMRLYVEPTVTLRRMGGNFAAWFDGRSVRGAVEPFAAFANAGVLGTFPLAAGNSGRAGVALALSPEMIVSHLSVGASRPDDVELAVRQTLEPGENRSLSYECFSFDAAAGTLAAAADYQGRHPEFFALDADTDRNIYRNNGQYLVNWQNAPWKLKTSLGLFSEQELNRRSRSGWVWYYASTTTAGNWALDKRMTRSLPPVNDRLGGEWYADYFAKLRNRDFGRIDGNGISVNYYILDWAEQRYANFFRDSTMNTTAGGGDMFYLSPWYLANADLRDILMMPYGTAYGRFFRRQLGEILRQNPEARGFAYDVVEGPYRFRGVCDFPEGAAYDEYGNFFSYLAANAKCAEHIRTLRTAAGKRPSLVGNPKFHNTAYSNFFRMDSIIAESKHMEFIDYESEARLAGLMMGERPFNLFSSYRRSLFGNYIPEPEKISRQELRVLKLAMRMRLLQLSFLRNTSMTHDLVFGIREVVEAQDELLRLRMLGKKLISPFAVAAPLENAFYGTLGNGALVLANPELVPHLAAWSIPSGRLLPLTAISGEKTTLTRKNGLWHGSASVSVPPLEQKTADIVGSLDGAPDRIVVEYSRDFAAARLKLRWENAGQMRFSAAALPPGYVISCFVLNGKPSCYAPGVTLPGSGTLELEWRSKRWATPAAEVAALELIGRGDAVCGIAVTDEIFRPQALRLQEYFSFWTGARREKRRRLVAPIMGNAPAEAVMIVLRRGESDTITRHGSHVIIESTPDKMPSLLEEYLTVLDRKYPFYGMLGCQDVNSYYDSSSTPEQRKLMERADLFGGSWSWREVLADYRAGRENATSGREELKKLSPSVTVQVKTPMSAK